MGACHARNAGIRLQRVDVEEALAVQLHAREHGVVEGELHHVGILALHLVFQHPAAEKQEADGGAGLRIGGVGRQIVGDGERFPLHGGADAAGDIHLFLHDVFPQAAAGGKQGLIARLRGEVCHRRIQIDGAHGVAHRLRLLPDGFGALAVVVVPRVAVPNRPAALFCFLFVEGGIDAALVDKALGKAQKPFVARQAVQLEQGELDLGMAGAAGRALRDEAAVNAFGVFDRRIQQFALARGFKIGARRLDHVPGAVQLVRFQQVGPALVFIFDGEVGIEVPVCILRGGDEGDQLVRLRLQLFVPLGHEGVCRRFQPFRRVAVLEHHAVKAVAHVFAAQRLSGVDEVGGDVALFGIRRPVPQHAVLVRDDGIPHQLLILLHESRRRVRLDGDLRLYFHPLAPFLSRARLRPRG